MCRISLDGAWKLYYFQHEEDIGGPSDLQGRKWVNAQVPGNVELDLQRVGELPDDLFKGHNIQEIRRYELYNWWYQTEFLAPILKEGQRAELVFHGVDCLADYWLNEDKFGESANMLCEQRFDVTSLARQGDQNTITVKLRSPVVEAMLKEFFPQMRALPTNYEQLWIRKAPHMYGWDIMCRAVSAGLWRGVELVMHERNEIEDIYFVTREIDRDNARIEACFHLNLDPAVLNHVSLRVHGQCGDSAFNLTEKLAFVYGVIGIDVTRPKLWWPRGYGEPCLYEVTAELLLDGEAIDIKHYTIGLRTVELDSTELAGAENNGRFLFKLNGIPIMCKGSNWVPADAFHSRDAQRYRHLLDLFTDLECNIIRCWGGNVYEDHAFFDYCDRHGIMVWQDMAMACGMYPLDSGFYDNLRAEVKAVVRKLRNHPSIIVWVGDNECDHITDGCGINPNQNVITREILSREVFRNDPYRPFIPSSPHHAHEIWRRKDTSLLPENHLWGPRDYYKSRFYTESKAHFIGEIGYHGCPNVTSIHRFIESAYLWPWRDNPQWIEHCTSPQGQGGPYVYRLSLMANQIKELFGFDPGNLDEFALASQISQAEADKFFIEMTRLKKWERTGIIWWNVVDGWPQFSDAVVDYYLGKKLAYYYIRRVQQPVCLMIDEPKDWHVAVVAGNDSLADATGQYRICDADTNETLMAGTYVAKANQNVLLGRIRVSMGEHRLLLIEFDVNGKKQCNHYLLGFPPFDFHKYQAWLSKIANLDESFDAAAVAH